MPILLSIVVIISFLMGGIVGTSHGPDNFVRNFSKTPACFEKTVGAETVKKCYIAVEVKE